MGVPFTLKRYLKAKNRRIMETQIFHHAKKKINIQKIPLKRNQNPSRYYN
jgi:hypothetical protein